MIRSDDDVHSALLALQCLDARLVPVVAMAGQVPIRASPQGLRGLAGTIVAQQVSRTSAAAIFGRLCSELDIDDAAALAGADDETFRRIGLSRPKQRTLRAVAAACLEGRLDFRRIASAPPADAISELVALYGIGPWTAQCYLLFSAGHPDIFPAGDLALQAAVGHVLGLAERPKEKAVEHLAAGWSPHRSVAARLFWAYYAVITRRDATPAEAEIASEAAERPG